MQSPLSAPAGGGLSVTRSLLVNVVTGVLRSLDSCVVGPKSLDGASKQSELKAPCVER